MEKQSTRKFLKLFVALVALFLLGSSALLLSSCKEEHTHDWGEGTVSVQPTCTAQGFKTFECSCGAVRTEPIQATGHKWDEGKVTTEPTCQPGVKTYTCQNCGETKTESIAATTGHEWVLNEELTVAPTCAKDGVKFYECANCGATQEIVDPATGNHEYNYEYIDASCEEWGIVIITCKNCTYYKQETDSSKPPLEHNYIVNTDDPNYVAPTCVSQGYGTFECTRCNDTYAGPIAALTTNGQHQWIVNTDTDDTLPGFVLGVGNNYATVDEAKAAGWTTVTKQNCTTNGVFQRVCDRCGEVETKNAPATGHKPAGYDTWYATLSGDAKTAHDALSNTQKLNAYFLAQRESQGPIGICMPQDDLTDAQGNKYAFECVNPNCPCEVVVDSYGNTANLVPAVAHTWTNANGTEIPWMPVDGDEANCTEDGTESRTCPVCGFVDVRDVEALDHTWNTIQLDSRTEAIVCATDDALSASATAAQKQALIKAVNEYYKNDAYKANYIINQIQTTLTQNSGKSYSRFCFACGALEEAKEHDYVVSKLTDIYDINSYETDEDGNVVVAEGIDATDPTEFTCAYVLVCKNCGTPDHIGSHGTFTTATCRERSECPICHIPGDAQLAHVYLDMGAILNEDTTNGGHADSAQVMNGTAPYTYNNKAVTYGQLRDAYEKLKGDETWMTPVTATCTSSGTEVHICYTCLLDAAAGAEFDWKTTDEAPTEAVNSYSAWIKDVLDGHDWVATYYDVDATDPMTDTAINRATTSCDSGFKVAYFCADCKTLYKNVPVADDPTTTEVVESKDNKLGDHGYTNEAGFVLTENAVDSSIDMTKANQYLAAAQAADLKEVDNHKGDHVVYIDFNFAKTNGYVASNCVEKAIVPVVCVNCGAQLQYTFDELEAMHNVTDGSTDKVNFVFATAQDLVNAGLIKTTDDAAKFAIVVDSSNWDTLVGAEGALNAAANYDENNHKNQPFACGDHCNAYVEDAGGTKHYCSGFSSDGSTVTVGEGTSGTITAAQLEESAHTTVTVSFQLSARLNTRYLDGYVLNIATVEPDDFKADGSIDWTKVDFSTGDKVSKCSATDGNTAIYELPALYPEAGLKKGDISTTETYFVLLKDGVPYPITVNYNVYNEDANKLSSAESMLVSGILGSTTKSETSVSAPQGDNYFVDFNYNTTSDLDNATIVRPEVPVEASDATSLVLAAENAVRTTSADGKVITDTITFKAGATISFEEMEDTDLQAFFTEISDSCTADDTVTDVVIDLNGGKLVLPGTLGLNKGSFYGEDEYGYSKLTIKNGTIESKVTSGYAITVDNDANSVVFDNVDIISYNNGISVSYNRTLQTGNVTLQNGSTLTAYGTYGIFINSPGAAAEPTNGRVTVLKLNGATVDMTRNPANLTNEITTDDGWKLSTALFIGAPVNVTVDKSFLKAAGQAVVIRAGTLSMADTELTLYAGYVDPTVETVDDLGYSNIINITSVGYSTEANKGITFVDGYSMQYWRQLGVWGTGNNVVRAALVIGNSYDPETSDNYYDVATNVTLNRISFVNDTTETGAQNIAIAARYSIAAPTEGSKVGSVNVTWRNNDLKSAVSANSIMSLITLNSDNLGD